MKQSWRCVSEQRPELDDMKKEMSSPEKHGNKYGPVAKRG